MRIRTVKPELWTDLDLAGISEGALLLGIALLNFADDEGYFPAHPGLIKGALFPVRELSRPIGDCLVELAGIGFIRIYKGDDGHDYGHIVNFKKHQVVSKPRKSVIAPKIKHDSGSIPGKVSETSGSVPSGNGMEWNGNGKRNGSNKLQTGAKAPEPPVFPDNLNSDRFKCKWAEWEKHRREIRKALKPSTREKQLAQCSEWGKEKALRAIDAAITAGWTGLFDPDQGGRGGAPARDISYLNPNKAFENFDDGYETPFEPVEVNTDGIS